MASEKKKAHRDEGYTRALTLFRGALCAKGILASTASVANYKRIWARDAVVSGLAALLTGEGQLVGGLRATLTTLAAAQQPNGAIPGHVDLDARGEISDAGFGTICGRVDPPLWFVIGLCNYVHFTGDMEFASQMEQAVEKALKLLVSWEFNFRGLIYVPQSGGWADEYYLHGYLLLEQLLRLWALQTHAETYSSLKSREAASSLSELIAINYWPRSVRQKSDLVYHPRAYQFYTEERGEPSHFLAGFAPGGYFDRFDAFANALAILLDVADAEQREKIVAFGREIRLQLKPNMIPCFWPPVQVGEPGWRELQNNYKYKFSNLPCQYHNGGLWPMINGWWGQALAVCGKVGEIHTLRDAVDAFNRKGERGDWGFYEYGHAQTGEPMGTDHMTWSAAGALMLYHCLQNTHLFFG